MPTDSLPLCRHWLYLPDLQAPQRKLKAYMVLSRERACSTTHLMLAVTKSKTNLSSMMMPWLKDPRGESGPGKNVSTWTKHKMAAACSSRIFLESTLEVYKICIAALLHTNDTNKGSFVQRQPPHNSACWGWKRSYAGFWIEHVFPLIITYLKNITPLCKSNTFDLNAQIHHNHCPKNVRQTTKKRKSMPAKPLQTQLVALICSSLPCKISNQEFVTKSTSTGAPSSR